MDELLEGTFNSPINSAGLAMWTETCIPTERKTKDGIDLVRSIIKGCMQLQGQGSWVARILFLYDSSFELECKLNFPSSDIPYDDDTS